MFFKNILNVSKIIFINFFILFLIIFICEIFLGTWFENNFKYKLASERNINRVYKFDFLYHKGTSHYVKNSYGFRVKNNNFDPRFTAGSDDTDLSYRISKKGYIFGHSPAIIFNIHRTQLYIHISIILLYLVFLRVRCVPRGM